MVDKLNNRLIEIWFFACAFLISAMIIIGGGTRIMDAGLSITNWELFSGAIPPLNLQKWMQYFELYKQTPEYELVNFGMSLADFKVIFWWEWLHRFLGRFLGLFYLLPFLYFISFRKFYNNWSFIFIFCLILIQGIIGWWMVKSGLINRVDVSPFRLLLHLSMALLTLSFVVWELLYMIYRRKNVSFLKNIFKSFDKKFFIFVFIIFLLQIIFGAYVAATRAGLIYNDWPLMNGHIFPPIIIDEATKKSLWSMIGLLFTEQAIVQFIHRILAYILLPLIIILGIILIRKGKKNNNFKLRRIGAVFHGAITFQVIIGVLTLIHSVPLFLGILHQLGMLLLLITFIILFFNISKSKS